MRVRELRELLQDHEFFRGLDSDSLAFIAGCGSNAAFRTDQYIFREGEAADHLYVVRSGRVALEISAPGGSIVIDAVDDGGIVGASWLFPPYRWELDARAVVPTSAIRLDATCLRGKCEQDPQLGYELMKRVAEVIRRRMQSARLRLLDLYGHARTG